jgi:peptidoglycan/xylan/chitin deacetylase (PgdA/CDA1 family)
MIRTGSGARRRRILLACAAAATVFATLATVPRPVVAAATRPVAAAAASERVSILMYHFIRVNPNPRDSLGYSLSVTPWDFRQQMDWLKANGAHTVSVGDVMTALEGGRPLPTRAVVISFDDGFDNFYSEAVPVMTARGFVGETYAVPGFLGRPGYMTATQLQDVARMGMVVGAHTVNHVDLTRLSSAQAWAEIAGSRNQLRQITGQPVEDFAYPYGTWNGGVASLVQQAGFRDAVTTASGSIHSLGKRYWLDRVRVSGGESLGQFAASVALQDRATPAPPTPPVAPVPPSVDGYWLVGANGAVFDFAAPGAWSSTAGLNLNQGVVGMSATPGGLGYWLAASDGGVFPFGDAGGYGSTGALRLNAPIVGMAATPSGRGYWLVATDGGIFPFGDAGGYGSTGALRLNSPVVGMAATPSGRGYWLVASDGGIFPFGDAGGYGSTGAMRLNRPIVGMAATHSGHGYWLVASDGGIFPFGDARGLGSMGGTVLLAPIVGMSIG